MERILFVCCIDDNNIVVESLGIYIYKFVIVNEDINIIDKKFISNSAKIYDVFNFKNYIIFEITIKKYTNMI